MPGTGSLSAGDAELLARAALGFAGLFLDRRTMSTSWTIDIETRRAADEAWRLLERQYIGGGALLDWLVTPYPWPPTLANEGFTAFHRLR